MSKKGPIDHVQVWQEYEQGMAYNERISLGDTVKANEDFFIGKQWEGVQANGLPTPVFNIIKRIVLYLVATTATDNVSMAVHPLESAYPGMMSTGVAQEGQKTEIDMLCDVVGSQFTATFEQVNIPALIRTFMRDAAVRGDACIYAYFDPEAETGQEAKGALQCEVLENTRVYFGNPNVREVQGQPFIIISRRERVEDVREEAKANGGEHDLVKPESDELSDRFDALTDDKVTTLTRFWREGGSIRCIKTVKDTVVRRAWDTGMSKYPIVWMCWDHVTNSYHGQAVVTGLIPNQIFVNKLFAMTMLSLTTTAFPKVVYDKTKLAKWDSRVGQAIGINGGNMNEVAKIMDPATISPQVGQFIEMAISQTKELRGATEAAVGHGRPENTSAILALQKSSSVPMEMVKQDLYKAIEDLGRIWMDQMTAYYGQRWVQVDEEPMLFDFGQLRQVPLSLKLDVGGSAYWSEIAQLQTLDNLLTAGHIDIIEYLKRLPNGYISDQEELIRTLEEERAAAQMAQMGAMAPMEQSQPAAQPLAL